MLNASLNQELPQQAVSKELNHLNDFCLNLDENIPSSFLLIYHHNKIIENIEWEREKEREKKRYQQIDTPLSKHQEQREINQNF